MKTTDLFHAANRDARKMKQASRGRSGTNRDWLTERAHELGIRPAVEMRPLRVRSLRSAT